jgi:hypothetical protein
VLIALAAVCNAGAANVHVTYLVECADFLEAGSRLERWLTLELYGTRTCDAPALLQEYVAVEAGPVPDRRTDRPPQPSALVLEADVALERSSPELYARVIGTGVTPLGGACQRVTERARDDVRLARRCPPDSVPSSGLCIDRWEATVWEIPAAHVDLVCKVIEGSATLRDLTVPGVRQVGFPGPPFGHATVPGTFLSEGAYTTPLYAASLPGVLPSTYVSAYQAWAACGFSGKRLPTSGEWTAAATGTPSRADDAAEHCNTGAGAISAGAPVKTGSLSRCVSTSGAYDMVGNVSEWTMDGHSRTRYRGGAWDAGDRYGIAFTQPDVPLTRDNAVGFRCVR